jgi:hypothetical protein
MSWWMPVIQARPGSFVRLARKNAPGASIEQENHILQGFGSGRGRGENHGNINGGDMIRHLICGLGLAVLPALPSAATEATDNALHKGVNPLREALGRPVHANRVFQKGYHCWDPALVKVGDTYHLFHSRWKLVPGKVNDLRHWMDSCEIVHCTSKRLLGPYVPIENPALSAKDNVNGFWLANCKVTPEYTPDGGFRRYLLYFINVKPGAVAGTSWYYSKDLSPGSWRRASADRLKEAPFNNPALLLYPDGSAYALAKANDPAYPKTGRHLFAYRTGDYHGSPDDFKKRWGDPLPNGRGSVNQLPGDVDHEDACLWEVGGHYHALMTDMSGRATGGKKKAVMHWYAPSSQGTNYRLYSDIPLAYVHTPVAFQEGVTHRYYRMERPQVYVNPDTGAVEAFLLACVPREASQSCPEEGANIIIWPVDSWKPSLPGVPERD